MHRSLGILSLSLVLPFGADGQTLTAREIFYKFTPPPAAAVQGAGGPKKAAAPGKTQNQGAPSAASPTAAGTAMTAPVATGAGRPEGLGDGAQLLAASTKTLKPLGLRYSIAKVTETGEHDVSPDTTFRSGDRIRVNFQSNDAGYLYIVMLGSSGNWQVLFPSAAINKGDNRIEAGHNYSIPRAPGTFRFDDNAGQEKLFIVLTRQPEPNLDKLIYSLTPTNSPTAAPEAPPKRMFAANSSVDDSTIGKLRNQFAARDLVFETVDENTPGEKKEKAVYVVNPTAKPDSRLVVDLKLQHQ